MDCPGCGSTLEKKSYRGIEVDQCPGCRGMWLDIYELDELEDKAFDVDDLKAELAHSSEPTERHCPHCGSRLQGFQYGGYSLELECCERGHGYWLDAGEEKKVLELMRQRANNIVRKFEAEAEWDKTLRRLRSPSLFNRLRGHFSRNEKGAGSKEGGNSTPSR
jgi:uncharacterized protein